jgi:adenylylsulfate kinase
MLLLQMTGLSGAGKTTFAKKVKQLLEKHSLKVEIIDGDVYRKTLCEDLSENQSAQQWLYRSIYEPA